MAPTKALAKLANRGGKKSSEGVTALLTRQELAAALAATSVSDVWGIGRKNRTNLEAAGIDMALQLRDADDAWILRELTVVGLKLVRELRGESCLPLELVTPAKKAICCSRSFGRPVLSLDELQQAVATYIARAAVKVRKQDSVAGHLQVWLETSRFHGADRYFPSRSIRMETATQSTPELLAAARPLVERMFRPGIDYRKAGCLLTDLRPAATAQLTLFDDRAARKKSAAVMEAVDKINQLHGRGAVQFGSEGTREQRDWQAKFNQLSPQYTNNREDLPIVRTG